MSYLIKFYSKKENINLTYKFAKSTFWLLLIMSWFLRQVRQQRVSMTFSYDSVSSKRSSHSTTLIYFLLNSFFCFPSSIFETKTSIIFFILKKNGLNAVHCNFNMTGSSVYAWISHAYYQGKSSPSSFFDDSTLLSGLYQHIGVYKNRFFCRFGRLNSYNDQNYVSIDDSSTGYELEYAYNTGKISIC
jgi:hypothetical protein